jgi:hypothetical protein
VKETTIPALLNHWAAVYCDTNNPIAKRHALIEYLVWLEIAAWEAYPWSTLLGEAPKFNVRPLHELEECLRQVDNKETPDLFAVTKTKGAPPAARKNPYWCARAAALITLLMRDFQKTENVAAKLVTEKMRICTLSLPGRTHARYPAWKRLQTWRDKLLIGKKGELARAWYDEVLLFASSKTENDLINQVLDPTRLPGKPQLI